MNTQPFYCDITSGSVEEQNEFKRLFSKATKSDALNFRLKYYGMKNKGFLAFRFEAEMIGEYRDISILPLSEGISILKKMVGEEEITQEDISVYIKTIRSNFEMWQKGEIKDGAFSWHLQNNLLHIEKILQPKP